MINFFRAEPETCERCNGFKIIVNYEDKYFSFCEECGKYEEVDGEIKKDERGVFYLKRKDKDNIIHFGIYPKEIKTEEEASKFINEFVKKEENKNIYDFKKSYGTWWNKDHIDYLLNTPC